MEVLIFAAVVFALVVYGVRRVRTGGSGDPTLSDDLRERETGDERAIGRSRVFGQGTDYAEFRVPKTPRVEREAGHGKDGGG